jgi:hypothetical protein
MMFGMDFTTLLVMIAAAIILFVALDFLFAGGGMTSAVTLAPHASAGVGGAMQCGAAMMSSPYGWALILVIILAALGAFSFFFGYR